MKKTYLQLKKTYLPFAVRRAFILGVSITSILSGCTASNDEARVESLMGHRSWPLIRLIAKSEVEKREKFSDWPDHAGYVPAEHKNKVWVVMAMAGTPNGDVKRGVTLFIGDDGAVLVYKRNWEGTR